MNITLEKIIILALAFVSIAGGMYSCKNKSKHPPYKGEHLKLACGEKSFFWFDTAHSRDMSDRMFADIESELKAFRPDLILVEGGSDKETFETAEEAILQGGESSYAAYLAKESGVKVEDIEPPFPEQIAYLQSKYPAGKVLTLYLTRQLGAMQALGVDEDPWEEVTSMTRYLTGNGLQVPMDVITLDNILAVMNTYLPEPLTKDNWNEFYLPRYYAMKGRPLNDVYEDIYLFRNIYLIDMITAKKADYDRIFVVMGNQHLKDTEKDMRKLYECEQ